MAESRDIALNGTDAMIAVQGSMIASPVVSSMGSNTLLSSPGTASPHTSLCKRQVWNGWRTFLISTESYTQFSEPSPALAQTKSGSTPTPDIFPTTPGPLIFMATRGATRVDDDDDDDDAEVNDAAAGDDDLALVFSE